MLLIYVLKRTDHVDYDEARGFVIAARDADDAREFAACDCGDEGGDVWTNKKLTTCRKIGTAKKGGVKRGVILQDFLHG